MRFARACLSVGEDCGVVAIEAARDQLPHTVIVDALLPAVAVVDGVEGEELAAKLQLGVINGVGTFLCILDLFACRERACLFIWWYMHMKHQYNTIPADVPQQAVESPILTAL